MANKVAPQGGDPGPRVKARGLEGAVLCPLGLDLLRLHGAC